MTPLPGPEPWMANGFPPPSFVVDTEQIGTFAGARGRWLAVAAVLGAVLLIIGLLLIVKQGDDKTALTTGTTATTVSGTTLPTFTDTSVLEPTASLPPATTGPGPGPGQGSVATLPPATAATTAPPATTRPTTAAPGVLAASSGTVTLPKAPPQTGKVTLRNAGGSPLTYTTQSNFAGALTASPDTATIAPGATREVTITLDGSKVAEGTFNGKLVFSASGGSQQVAVSSVVGRPPIIVESDAQPCKTETTTCSKPIKPVNPPNADATPCDNVGGWIYSVTVTDDSQLKSVKAIAKLNGTAIPDVDLMTGGNTSGPQGLWQSSSAPPQPQLPAGAKLTFTIQAIDQFDNAASITPDRAITCP